MSGPSVLKKRGRIKQKGPPKFPKFDKIKRAMVLEGLSKGGRRIATCLAAGISYDTFKRAIAAEPEFYKAVSLAETRADDLVEAALHKLATGYRDPAGGFHAPNVIAAQVWLYNRRPEKWKDARNRIVFDGGSGEEKESVLEIRLIRQNNVGHPNDGASG